MPAPSLLLFPNVPDCDVSVCDRSLKYSAYGEFGPAIATDVKGGWGGGGGDFSRNGDQI